MFSQSLRLSHLLLILVYHWIRPQSLCNNWRFCVVTLYEFSVGVGTLLIRLSKFSSRLSISQLIRQSRACSSYECFILRARRLSSKLLKQGYVVERLKSSFRKFYGRYWDLIKKYEVTLTTVKWHSDPWPTVTSQPIRLSTNVMTRITSLFLFCSSSSGTRSPSIGFADCISCCFRRIHWPAIRNRRFYQAVLLWACIIAPTIFRGGGVHDSLMPSLLLCMHVCGEC